MCNAYNHPPGCTCGWGGEGHVGGGGAYSTISSFRDYRVREWVHEDFTRPTKCPECGAEVYFIRHNGGSVWVDELGWPWPKHACFDNTQTETVFSCWSAKASELTNAELGVVSRIRPSRSGMELIIEITLRNSHKIGVLLAWLPPEDSLLGALVCLSRQDKLLLHPRHGDIAIRNIIEIPKTLANRDWTQCHRCKAWVMTENLEGHEEHCSRHWPPAAKKKGPMQMHKPAIHVPATHDSKISAASIGPLSQLLAAAKAKDARIQQEVTRIVQESWDAVDARLPEDVRLKLAKREALRLIQMLSPLIRGAVHHYFTSNKWAPLIARDASA